MNAQLPIVTPHEPIAPIPEVPNKVKAYAPFQTVIDSRGNRIRGLWQRNGRFYAQLRIPGKRNAAKVSLVDPTGVPLRTVAQARAALHDLLAKRRTNSLSCLHRTPTLGRHIEGYVGWLRRTEAKSPLTVAKESGALAMWAERFGFIRVAHLHRGHINEFIAWRKQNHRVTNRTINLDIIALNNCLRHARDEGLIIRLPTENLRPLECRPRRRPLWTSEQIEKVCQAALAECSNGQSLADYIRFLAFTGVRRNEALQVKWADVDWANRRLAVRVTKYGTHRDVDLNPPLETLLRELQLRATPSQQWLFPNPRAPRDDQPARSLQASLEIARTAARLPDFRFHDLRHYFVSTCVMARIDYMTIARWIGHRDGGVLIGRVYGHLRDEHAKKMAALLVFGDEIKLPTSHEC